MTLGVEEVFRSLTLPRNITDSGSAITRPCDQNVLCKYDVYTCQVSMYYGRKLWNHTTKRGHETQAMCHSVYVTPLCPRRRAAEAKQSALQCHRAKATQLSHSNREMPPQSLWFLMQRYERNAIKAIVSCNLFRRAHDWNCLEMFPSQKGRYLQITKYLCNK